MSEEVKVDEALQDINGFKSSKRVWLFRYGWTTIAQVILSYCISILFTLIGKDMPPSLLDLLQYGITITGSLSALFAGLSIPEWFSPRRKND